MSSIEKLKQQVQSGKLPRHVGIIMDGNGRWAEARGLPRLEGHREGARSVRAVTRTARQVGVQALTLYAFSSQNWQRPADEVAGLMALLRDYLTGERDEIMQNGIRLTAIGEIDRLPKFVREPLDALMQESASNTGMVLALALSYGGREELVRACRRLMEEAKEGLDPGSLDAKLLESRLFTADFPELDLVIRTSGEQRISNFLLWQCAYAELTFTDTAWPEFREEAFLNALLDFQTRERRYGLTGAQLKTMNRASGTAAS
ncbi:MAG: isoprenyl transferase [Myxococcales bacterium]